MPLLTISLSPSYYITDIRKFITKFVHKSYNSLKFSKVDTILKGIINTYRFKFEFDTYSGTIIDYLNKLRVVYFLRRLRMYSTRDYNTIICKYITLTINQI